MNNEKLNDVSAYKSVLDLMDKHKEFFEKEYELDIRSKLKTKINVLEISNDFGINVMNVRVESYGNFFKLNDYCSIGLWGEVHRRTISWSDDGKQPSDEWLYQISFPTGAYIFGEHYPTDTFNKFFDELKSFQPKYSDSNNHNLYFAKDTAKNVHDSFSDLMKKYRDLSKDEYKKNQINELEKKLELLKGLSHE